MTTDFNYNNKTINSGGPIKPSGTDQPGDPRTRVDFYSDIESIPNPYIGMIVTVKMDETNQNKMTDYKVLSLKANVLGIANSVIDRVQKYSEYLGVNTGGSVDLSGYATKDELNSKANTSDIPTNTSELNNDSGFLTSIPSEYVTETEMNEAIANISSGGSVSQEDISTAVNNYLTEHPVTGGATTEQANQIEANKTNISTLKELVGDSSSGLVKAVTDNASQLDKKANLNSVFSMTNMGQDIKEAMTGGSVAVVGVDAVLTENIVDGQITPIKTSFFNINHSTNYINELTLLNNYSLDKNGGQIENTNRILSDFIEIPKNVNYIIPMTKNGENFGINMGVVCQYNSNKIMVNRIAGKKEPVPIVETAKYLRISFDNANTEFFLGFNSDGSPFEYEEYRCIEKINTMYLPQLETQNSNELIGKNIIGIGDSIMRGAGNNNVGIAQLIADKYQMNCEVVAVSGQSMANHTTRGAIWKQIDLTTMINPDFILIDGGVNDVYGSDEISLGEIIRFQGPSSSAPDSCFDGFDCSTFCGALEQLFRNLVNKYPLARIIYITPHKMSNIFYERTDGSKPFTLCEINKKVIDGCQKWGIEVVDLFNTSRLNTSYQLRDKYIEYVPDQVHPNQLGYELFYLPKIEAKMKEMI